MAKVHLVLAAALAATVSACAVPDSPSLRGVASAPPPGNPTSASIPLVPEPLPPEVERDRAALAALGQSGTGSPETAVARAFQPAAAVGRSAGARSVTLAALPRPVSATTRIAVHVPAARPVAVAKEEPRPAPKPAAAAAVEVAQAPPPPAPAQAPAEQKRPGLLLALLQRLQMAIQ